ncbi:hypothetical protein H5410_040114 [Solanum commersonii]|uniref:Uncharacterized protein n=1 Tax=Solanum commersonii TaxID=4109 RepID=A0A9J5XR57_SOLCO|nr:hypothetical protein H5410_040114 [Solanum commersonii]
MGNQTLTNKVKVHIAVAKIPGFPQLKADIGGVDERENSKSCGLWGYYLAFETNLAICFFVWEAARVLLSQDFSGKIRLATLPSIYEKAKNNLEFLLERLPSGPSPRGPGH